MRQSLSKFVGHSTMPNSSPTQIMSCFARFDVWFSAIIIIFWMRLQDKYRTDAELWMMGWPPFAQVLPVRPQTVVLSYKSLWRASHYLSKISLTSIFGRCRPWEILGETTQMTLDSATAVYAYHLMKINNEDKQKLYVGQTTKGFASRWASRARHRKATERPKKYSSKL